MKKIINGKTYNTNTAKKVGEYMSDLPRNDFDFYEEALYRKKTGEYFICGEGGARTKYAARDCDMWCYGEAIIPTTDEEAQKWIERHM